MNAALPSVLDYPHAAPPAPGEVVAVAPRVLWLRMPLPFALDHINLWLLADPDDGFTLVDCGIGDAATRALWERHAATTLAARPIRRIIATHCHPDHVGNAAWLAARFDAPVAMTHAEFLTAHAIRDEHSGYSLAATADLFRRHGMTADQLAQLRERGNGYRRLVPELPTVFDRLLDGDLRNAGGTTWRIVEGHGHSPEHASLYSAERGVLIAGDMLLPRISTNVSVWAVERDGNPLTASSIRSPPSRRCRRTRWCCPRTGCRSAASRRASRSCARTTRRGSTSSTTPCAPPPRRKARPSSCPCSSGASSTCSSATSRWARPSPISTFSGARRGSNAMSPPMAR